MIQFTLKYLASGELVGYESQPMAMMALMDAYPSGAARNPSGELVTAQTKDWPVRDGLIFTFWTSAASVGDPASIFAQLVTV